MANKVGARKVPRICSTFGTKLEFLAIESTTSICSIPLGHFLLAGEICLQTRVK